MKESLERLVTEIQGSSKYRHIAPSLVQRLGMRELQNQSSYKAAVKAVKNKLHQTAGAYFSSPVPYAAFLDQLHRAETPDQFKAICMDMMRIHLSTAERLPILEDFYGTIWADLPPIQRVIDIACGLNPLAIPWMMPAPPVYPAYDVYTDLMEFLGEFLGLMNLQGGAQAVDIAQFTPTHPADLALILKTLPCLEQTDKQISLKLLERIPARFLLVSYPVQSLGGRNKGMRDHYEVHLRQLLYEKNWSFRRYEFATELAFLVDTHAD